MLTWVEAHGFESLLIYFMFIAITGGMPTPADNAGVTYRWVFSTFQLLNGSLARLVATQFSGSKIGQALQGQQPVSPVVVAKPEALEKP